MVNGDVNFTRSGSIDLSLFNSLGSVQCWRTSESEHHEELDTSPIAANRLNYDSPPASVTTCVVSDALFNPLSNLIPSGDFEFGEESQSGWTTDGDSTLIVSQDYIRTGNFSGVIKPVAAEEEVRLVYTLQAEESKTYYLSAWCAGGGSTTAVLGVQVNGETVEEVNLAIAPGYHVYGIPFAAMIGDSINIYLKASTANTASYIDDVVLH